MQLFIRLLASVSFFFSTIFIVNGQVIDKRKDISKAVYLSLTGDVLKKGNPAGADGNLHQITTPLLRIFRSKFKPVKGTMLVLPGGGYEVLRLKNEGISAASFFNAEGFDVAVLDYHLISPNPENHNLSLADALQAYRLLKANAGRLGLNTDRLDVTGFNSGGYVAAQLVQKLGEAEQPANLLLISPSYLNQPVAGTVIPAIKPPLNPTAGLFTAFYANDKKEWVTSCSEYVKTWIGYGGTAVFNLLTDTAYMYRQDAAPLDKNLKLAGLLKSFLAQVPAAKQSMPNPAALPVAGHNTKRHDDKLALVAKQKYELIMIGNSITNNFEKPEYQPVWNQFFAPRKALNLGFSGYRTENIIWNLENGELNGQSPKVVVLEIGTNNVDEKNYPTRHTAGQLAGGIAAIINILRQKLPDTKIIVMRCFPGCYGGPNPTSHRAILERASDLVSRLADNKHVFYCDVNHVFLNIDGSVNQQLMGDWLHPTPAGAKAWAQAMEPLLSQLMGDRSLDTEISNNTAIVPVPKLEEDSYNWYDRHAEVLRLKDSINPQIVMIGNSITHFWGGLPQLKYADGKLRAPNGPKSWQALFGPYRVLNMGFGWDRTQNVLWRLDHGELDGLNPRLVVINIGTNNTSETANARMNTAAEIVEGINAVYNRVRSKVPGAKIIVMAIFPREKDPMSARRILINEINRQLEDFTKSHQIIFLNIGPDMLAADGTFLPDMMLDFTHPTDKGYQVWANGLRPFIDEL